MRRRLWLIDLALLALVAFTASALRDKWQQTKVREEALLRQALPKPAPPVIPPLPGVMPTTAVSYSDVAQQFLFAKDRNPNVILDPPAPPPPPKPMPPLPLAYGVLDLGSGPTVILSERSGAEHRGYRTGEKIGEFTLVAVSRNEITFEWDGKPVTKKLDELIDKRAAAPPEAASTPVAAPQATPGTTTLAPVKAGPGVELGPTTRACAPNDATPAGTVQDGYKKVVMNTPFGASCRWEAVK